jgi:hypothetical protein
MADDIELLAAELSGGTFRDALAATGVELR